MASGKRVSAWFAAPWSVRVPRPGWVTTSPRFAIFCLDTTMITTLVRPRSQGLVGRKWVEILCLHSKLLWLRSHDCFRQLAQSSSNVFTSTLGLLLARTSWFLVNGLVLLVPMLVLFYPVTLASPSHPGERLVSRRGIGTPMLRAMVHLFAVPGPRYFHHTLVANPGCPICVLKFRHVGGDPSKWSCWEAAPHFPALVASSTSQKSHL